MRSWSLLDTHDPAAHPTVGQTTASAANDSEVPRPPRRYRGRKDAGSGAARDGSNRHHVQRPQLAPGDVRNANDRSGAAPGVTHVDRGQQPGEPDEGEARPSHRGRGPGDRAARTVPWAPQASGSTLPRLPLRPREG